MLCKILLKQNQDENLWGCVVQYNISRYVGSLFDLHCSPKQILLSLQFPLEMYWAVQYET